MSYKKIFWGVILVLLGTALILKNLGILWFSWYGIWRLWPVLLILWGVSLIPVKDYIKLIISLLIVALSVSFLYKERNSTYPGFHFDWNEDNEEVLTGVNKQNLSEEWDSTLTTAVLNFDAAAGAFKIDQSSLKLIEFEKNGEIGTYSMEIQKEGDTATVDLNMHGQSVEVGNNRGNNVTMRINADPIWNFNMDVGAASIDMDLTKFKIGDIHLDGGASSVDLKLGILQKTTNLDIETGASSITIRIPKDAGCELKSNTFMTSRNIDGFNKIESGLYRTANYSSSSQKISINVESAISSLDIERY